MSFPAVLLAALFFGLAPMLVYAALLWWFDRYEREPWPLLAAAFLWGFFPAAFLAIVVGLVFDLPVSFLFNADSLPYQLISSGLNAPLIEEAIKGLGLFLAYRFFREEMDSLFDGILYGGLIGFGFAAIENILYLSTAVDSQELVVLALMRAFVFGLNHALYTSLMGAGFALAHDQRRPGARVLLVAGGYLAAVAVHAAHNLGVTLAALHLAGLAVSLLANWLGVAFVFGLILASLVRQGRRVRRYLQPEVEAGVLTENQVAMLASVRRRLRARLGALVKGDLRAWRRLGRLQQAASELAFARYRVERRGSEGDLGARLAALEAEVRRLAAARPEALA